MTPTNPPRWRVLVASLLALSFVAGAFAGIAADRLMAPRLRIRATVGDMSDVLDRLALTPAQRAQADGIVARTAPRSRAIMIELAERLRLVSDSVDTELRAILTPAQRARLDSLKREPRFVLKRKVNEAGRARVDTVMDTGDAARTRP